VTLFLVVGGVVVVVVVALSTVDSHIHAHNRGSRKSELLFSCCKDKNQNP